MHFINYLRLAAKSLDWNYDKATYDAYGPRRATPTSGKKLWVTAISVVLCVFLSAIRS